MLEGVRSTKFIFVSVTGEISDREQIPKLLRASFGNTNRIKSNDSSYCNLNFILTMTFEMKKKLECTKKKHNLYTSYGGWLMFL